MQERPDEGIILALWLGATLAARSRFRYEVPGTGWIRGFRRFILRLGKRLGTAMISAIFAWNRVAEWVWQAENASLIHRKES